MESRTFGATGISVSPLALSGSFGVDADATERAFHELGVSTFFVTRRVKGLVEGVRRLIAAGHRDRITLICGAAIPFGFSVEREWKSMAKTLGVEQIDVFLLYWVQAHWYVTGNTWPALAKLKEDGKARALGVSCHDRPMARALVDELSLDALMIRYNAAHRGAEREIFDSLDATARPGIISYTATRWGRLLKAAEGHGPMSAGECYRFALAHPKVDTVLSGARNWDEISDSARELERGALDAPRLEEIKRFGDAVRSTATGRLGFVGA